jgi:hypothetical protein
MERDVAAYMSGGSGVPFRHWLAWAVTGVLAGAGLHQLVRHPAAAVAAATALFALGGALTSASTRLRARSQPEPGSMADLAAYREWLPRRVPPVPAATLTVVDRYLAQVTSHGWGSAQLLLARYKGGPPGPMGGTNPVGDRLELVLGSHVAEGPTEVAAVTVAHEMRHMRQFRLAMWDLAVTLRRQQVLIIIAGWEWSWAAAVVAVVALRLAAMLICWSVEVSCDLGAAADHGAAAMRATYEVMTAGRRARGAAHRPARQAISGMLHWASAPTHPPIALRRAITCTVHRTSA